MSKTQEHSTGSTDWPTDAETAVGYACSEQKFTYFEPWCEHFGVAKWLVPTGNRPNPITLGNKINNSLNDLRQTVATFTRRDIDIESYSYEVADPLLFAHNVVVFEQNDQRKRYYNPRYIHYSEYFDSIIDVEKRKSFYRRYNTFGTVTPRWIASHFGITSRSLLRFVKQKMNGKPPLDKLRDARAKVGKTAIMLSKWGYLKSDIANAIGIPRATLYDYIRHVDTDWRPPAPPHTQHGTWFDSTDIESHNKWRKANG